MILFRALNNDDINNLNKYDHIYSSLYDSFNKSKENNKQIRKNVYNYSNLCFNGKRKYALDTIIGHISGKRIGAKISPWVSVSNDFDLVSSEYSIPQSGRYNYSRDRKSIAIIDLPDDFIKSNKAELLEIRESNLVSLVVDLRNGNLNKFYDCGAVQAEKYNADMPGYNSVADFNREVSGYKTNVSGFSNFATAVSEMVAFAGISKKFVKTILSPIVVDIVYACNITDYDFIIKYNNELKSLISDLYPLYTGNNLVDILYNNYKNIKGNNIEEKYNYLMNQKIIEISKIVEYINKIYNKDFKVSRLLDNRVIVKSYNDLPGLNSKIKNDLVLIEKDNNVYYNSFDKNGYYNDELNKVITFKKVLNKINK